MPGRVKGIVRPGAIRRKSSDPFDGETDDVLTQFSSVMERN